MAEAEVLTHVWREWGIQALVLLSFTLQVTLLILAEFRRHIDSGVLRFFVWSAYMLADATAIYVLGHMSVTSMSPKHELVAFWAPFLLMHLGGQDNITAYAIEDNQLWLRHLQTLAVQVVAAGYILYKSSIPGGPSLLRWAITLMFVAGIFRYGDRVWALRYAGRSRMGENYRPPLEGEGMVRPQNYIDEIVSTGPWDTEAYLLIAQRTLDFPMGLLMWPVPDESSEYLYTVDSNWSVERQYKVVEMQLSLMHDVLYTKAEVVHSNFYGLCIRVLSMVATATAFLLFHQLIVIGNHHRLKEDDGADYNRVDVCVTYILSVGAVVLETASLFRALFSNWTCALLARKRHTLCKFFARKLTCIRRLVHVADWRRRCSWSRSMGQYNLLQMSTHSRISRRSKLARRLGVEDWWNTLAYPWSIPVSAFFVELLVNQVSKNKLDVLTSDSDRIFDSIGQGKQQEWGLYEWSLKWNLEERIIVWHIATNVYLCWWYRKTQGKTPMAEAVEALSNYMMFLLAARPHMLPPTASRSAYMEMCYALTAGGLGYSSFGDLVSKLRSYGAAGSTWRELDNSFTQLDLSRQDHLRLILLASCKLGARLTVMNMSQIEAESTLELLAQVWAEMLCYAALGCSAYSHAKQLSNGGELITVAALLLEHIKKTIIR